MTIPTERAAIRELGGLRSLEFNSLRAEGVPHSVFTRHGGRSVRPFHSFNLSTAVGDDPGAVQSNRELALASFAGGSRRLVQTRQMHGAMVVTANAAAASPESPKADGLISNSSDFILTMRYADCLPVLLYDRKARAIGLGHAGWKGTAAGIAGELVAAMSEAFGTHAEDLAAALGPAICARHYPVGQEVQQAVEHGQGAWALADFEQIDGQLHFDLVGANIRQLRRVGVVQIEESAHCTACSVEDWFSHRAEGGRTGRFGVYLALPIDA